MANISDSIVYDLESIYPQVNIHDYPFKNYFTLAASFTADKNSQKLEAYDTIAEYATRPGLVYLIVVDNLIFKIGMTSTTAAKRIQSYNCGKATYRTDGTCSVSNYYILQSLIALQNNNLSLYYLDLVNEQYYGTPYYEEALSQYYNAQGEVEEEYRPAIDLYVWYAPEVSFSSIFGTYYQLPSGDAAKRSENELITDFETRYGSKPIGNVQS